MSAETESQENLSTPTVVRCLILGDRGVGKSSLVASFTGDVYPEKCPTFSRFKVSVTLRAGNGALFSLELIDVNSASDLEHFVQAESRPDVFVVCFSVADHLSYGNARHIWIPALRGADAVTPFILVATKTDLRGRSGHVVNRDEGVKLAREAGAVRYIETASGQRRDGGFPERVNVDKVFRKILAISQNPAAYRKPGRKCCVL